jgi:phosphohistidine phosphatase
MKKELCILRHGMAESGNGKDYERKLTDSGRGRITRLAHLLQTREFIFDFALFSTAIRCKETFDILQDHKIIKESLEKPGIYQAGQPTLLQYLFGLSPSHQTVLLIGHNPGVSQLVGYLSGDLSLMLSPGMMVHLRFEGLDWRNISKNSGSIIEVLQ